MTSLRKVYTSIRENFLKKSKNNYADDRYKKKKNYRTADCDIILLT